MNKSVNRSTSPASTASDHDGYCLTDLDMALLNDILSCDVFTPLSIAAPKTEHVNICNISDMNTASIALSTTGNVSQANKSESTAYTVARKKPTKMRCGRKSELAALRTEVDELQIQVDLIKQEAANATAEILGSTLFDNAFPPGVRMILLGTNVSDAHTLAATENSCQRYVDDTQAAAREEMKQLALENVRLRSMAEVQLSISKNLRSILQNPDSRFVVNHKGPFASSFYDWIRASIEMRYRKIDVLLQKCGLANCDDLITWKENTRDNIASGGHIDGIDCRVLPFHRRDITRVLWSCVGMEAGHRATDQLQEISDNTVHTRSRHRIVVAKSETIATVHLVLKRFEEADRTVFLWEQHIETRGALLLRLKGEGIYLLRSPMGSDSNSHISVAQSHVVQISSKLDEIKLSRDSSIRNLTNVMLRSHQCNLNTIQHVVETVLQSETDGTWLTSL